MLKEAQLVFTEPTEGLLKYDHCGIQVVLNRMPFRFKRNPKGKLN